MQKKIKGFFTACRVEISIFIIAAVVRLVAGFFLQHYAEPLEYSFPVNGNDARGYAQIAENVLNHGVFSRSGEAPFLSDTLRTPGYPFFIAFLFLLFKSMFAVSVAQALLAGLTAMFVYRISLILFESSKLSLWAAFLFSFDPLGIFLSGVLLSETLFTFFLAWSVYALVKRKPAWQTGLLLGVTSLVRPVGLILFPLFLIAKWFFEGVRPVRAVGIFAGTFLLAVSPWVARNYILFDSFQLSDVSVRKLYSYDAPIFHAQRTGISESRARDELQEKLQNEVGISHIREMTLAHASQVRDTALFYIRGHEISFTAFYIFKSLPFFFTDGLRDVSREIHLTKGVLPSITDAILSGGASGWLKELKNNGGEAVLFLGGFSFWGIINVFMLVGTGVAFVKNHTRRYELLFLLLLVLGIGILTGTVANYRLRHPVTPFMFMIAVYGVAETILYIRKKYFAYEK